jgi:Fic family protein
MSWPAVGGERVRWDPPPERVGVTRAERSAAGRSYQAAVPAKIAGLSPSISSQITAQAEEAVAEMRAFDAATPSEAGSFEAILLRSESASSSQIEQLTASARAVAEAEITGAGRGNAAVVAANAEAMVAALELAQRLDISALVRMQETLLGGTAPHLVGLREEQVWIGGGGSTPLSADFVPPAHGRVLAALADLVEFMARDDLPVLIQASVAHAQFETIHPFVDGNGRAGRALVHALLRAKGVMRRVTVPVSGGLLHDKAAYIEALGSYRAGDPEPIVSVFALSSLRAVEHGQTMWRRLDQVRDGWSQVLNVRSDSAVWRLLDVLVAHPVVDAATAARLLEVAEPNVHRHLATLVDNGILVPTRQHRSRRTLWRAPGVLTVLDAYAADVGRRAR